MELQGTYVFDNGFSGFANGTLNDALAVGDPLLLAGNGKQIAKAPHWTAALGLRWERHGLIVGDDQFIATVNDKFIGSQYTNAATATAQPSGLIKAFSTANFTGAYHLGHYSLEGQILDLFDDQGITSAKGTALIKGTNLFAQTVAEGGGANQFTYQVGRSYQVTVKAAF